MGVQDADESRSRVATRGPRAVAALRSCGAVSLRTVHRRGQTPRSACRDRRLKCTASLRPLSQPFLSSHGVASAVSNARSIIAGARRTSRTAIALDSAVIEHRTAPMAAPTGARDQGGRGTARIGCLRPRRCADRGNHLDAGRSHPSATPAARAHRSRRPGRRARGQLDLQGPARRRQGQGPAEARGVDPGAPSSRLAATSSAEARLTCMQEMWDQGARNRHRSRSDAAQRRSTSRRSTWS